MITEPSRLGFVGIAGICLALWAATAGADDEFNRPGPYVGLGGSYLVEGFQDRTASRDFGNSLGFNARGGYRINDFFATEAIYEYGDDFGSDRRLGGSIQTNVFTVNGKLLLPLGRFQPYLMGGVGFLNANADGPIRNIGADASGTSFAGRFGGGVDLWATEHVSLFLDTSYTIPVDEVSDLQYFSFGWGARYNF
jgi:opacity protein-like surface antigen